MDLETIRRQARELQDIQQQATTLLRELQAKCDHSQGSGEYKADTGNWCPDDDSYWIDFKCSICGKRLFVGSKDDKELYNKLSRSGMVK